MENSNIDKLNSKRITNPFLFKDNEIEEMSEEVIENDIGFPGKNGFGVGIYPYSLAPLPPGISKVFGTDDITSAEYGNYRYSDGSVMCWIPKFYYRFTENNLEIASALDYVTEEDANEDGFALHRAFIDGDSIQTGFFIDKYFNSIKSGEEIPSSIKNGVPFTFSNDFNPFPNNFPNDNHVVDIAKLRGEDFFTNSTFIRNALALLSLAHGQAADDIEDCAWYDETGRVNYPKGCNTEELTDIDDDTVKYEEYLEPVDDADDEPTGYPKTGSGEPFAKTTHNGQDCGVADLNGVMGEYNLGLANYGEKHNVYENLDSNDFYILKEEVRFKDLTGGYSESITVGDNNAWGSKDHIETLYDRVDGYEVLVGQLLGNEDEIVFSPDITGDSWKLTCSGLPLKNGFSERGTDLFGKDFIIINRIQNRLAVSNFNRIGTIFCGIFNLHFDQPNNLRSRDVGVRLARYAY